MTRIGIVAELGQESRVAATPVTVRHLLGLGFEVVVEKGAGEMPRSLMSPMPRLGP